MKKTLMAIFILTSSFVAQAETVTYNASSCNVKYGNSEKNHYLGVIENRSGDYDILTCDLPIESGRTVDEVSISVYSYLEKANSTTSCHVSLFNADSVSFIASEETNSAENYKSTLVAELNTTLADSARGVISCSVGGVDSGGLVSFTSYSVSYSD